MLSNCDVLKTGAVGIARTLVLFLEWSADIREFSIISARWIYI